MPQLTEVRSRADGGKVALSSGSRALRQRTDTMRCDIAATQNRLLKRLRMWSAPAVEASIAKETDGQWILRLQPPATVIHHRRADHPDPHPHISSRARISQLIVRTNRCYRYRCPSGPTCQALRAEDYTLLRGQLLTMFFL